MDYVQKRLKPGEKQTQTMVLPEGMVLPELPEWYVKQQKEKEA